MRRTTWLMALGSACLIAVMVAGLMAFPQTKEPAREAPRKDAAEKDTAKRKDPPVNKVKVGRNVFVEIEDKKAVRVLVEAYVCLRQGSLEHLLTRRLRKEHEAILAADIDARDLHTALLLAGAEPGKTIALQPNGVPPSGSAVKISLAYITKKGKGVQVPAQQWVRHIKTKKDLQTDWVFAGSRFIVDEADPAKVFYLANDGDVICTANFGAALLDVPILSSAESPNDYEAHTERIPPLQTPVLVILEPVRKKKK
jgi:hypothetical protein